MSSADNFNSLGGYSVGIPPVSVVDANGNVITNVLTSGNVAANVFYATTYKYSNGASLSIAAAGSNTQVQFNNNGQFGADPYFVYDSYAHELSTPKLDVTFSANLGEISNVTITGGTNGYVLQTDGTGNLSWAASGGGGGNGTPGGANTQVQFNSAGSFAGSSAFVFNSTSNILSVPTANIVTINSNNVVVTSNVTANYFVGNGSYLTGIVTNLAEYVTENAQANITSVGTLTSLAVSGNIISTQYVSAANVQVAGNINSGNLSTGTAVVNTSLRALGGVNFNNSPNVSLGPVGNITISGGLNGYVLTTDGLGNLSWGASGNGGGGNGEPGGSNTQVQYNLNGDFGASPYFTFNSADQTVTIGGNLIANSLQIGSGIYEFCTSEVYFAATVSTSPSQVLYSIPVADISAVDFDIIATDSIDQARQSSKISSLYYAGVVQFTEYASLQSGGGVCDFGVSYNPGDIITPAALQLTVTPDTSNQVIYKMLITVYS